MALALNREVGVIKAEDASEKEIYERSFPEQRRLVYARQGCSICRLAKVDGAYSRGHDTPAKNTNHTRYNQLTYIYTQPFNNIKKKKKKKKKKEKEKS